MSTCYIGKSIASGTVCAPPSKSYAHRLLLAAFLSRKQVTISNIELSNDISATIDCIRALGGQVSVAGHSVTVSATSGDAPAVLDCRESGSTLRFMIPVALAMRANATFTGTEKLFSRGLGEYEKIFSSQGIRYAKSASSLSVNGRLCSGSFNIDGSVSSQYITGLLFALPLLDGDSCITITPPIQSRPYIDITLDVLQRAGVKAYMEGCRIDIPGGQSYCLADCSTEGDWSNAAFLDIYNYLGGKVQIEGLNTQSLQGDKIYREHFEKLSQGRCTIDLANCIDLGPVLFTMAAIKHGACFENTGRLRIKESDRVGDILQELSKAGVKAVAGDNFVEIEPIDNIPAPGIVFDSHNDHRLAMSLSALASTVGARIDGCEAVAKSFPDFYNVLKHLNIDVRN